jgi:hypothetical protein
MSDSPAYAVDVFAKALVALYRQTKDPVLLLKNVATFRDPRSFVYLATRFAFFQTVAPPELLLYLDERIDAAALRELDGHHVCELAYSLHAQGSPPMTDLFERLAARASEIGKLAESDAANLAAALGSIGIPMPPGIVTIPDAA